MSNITNEAIVIEEAMMRMNIKQIKRVQYDDSPRHHDHDLFGPHHGGQNYEDDDSISSLTATSEEQENSTTVFIETNSKEQAGHTTPWQRPDDDDGIRLNTVAMIKHILLTSQKKNNRNNPTNRKWLQKLPEMAQLLEEFLYKSSRSFEEYTNTRTLDFRIKLAAKKMVFGHMNRVQQGGMKRSSPPLLVVVQQE